MVGYRLSICLIPFHAPAFLPRQQEERPVEHPEILKREIKTLVFDQYGTVVDMQGGLTEAAAPFLKAQGWQHQPQRFVPWWRPTPFAPSLTDDLCDRRHTPNPT